MALGAYLLCYNILLASTNKGVTEKYYGGKTYISLSSAPMIFSDIVIKKCQFNSCVNGNCMGFVGYVNPRGTNSLPSKITEMKKGNL